MWKLFFIMYLDSHLCISKNVTYRWDQTRWRISLCFFVRNCPFRRLVVCSVLWVETSLEAMIWNFPQNGCNKMTLLLFSFSIIYRAKIPFLIDMSMWPSLRVFYNKLFCCTDFSWKFFGGGTDSGERKVSPIQKACREKELAVSSKKF